jgi:hypothetical protein
VGFPLDRYTPHGYLNLPTHTSRLRPLGVVRSWGVGFRWHVPAYAGASYNRAETYAAGIRLAVNGETELAAFAQTCSPYHSANLMSFAIRQGGARLDAEYHLVGEHAIRGSCRLEGDRERLALQFAYRRILSAAGQWGESGLVGRLEDGLVVLQGYEDGEAVILWSAARITDLGVTPHESDARQWLAGTAPGQPVEGFVTAHGLRGETVELHAVLGLDPEAERHEWVLARGRTLSEARKNLEAARRDAQRERARLLAADSAFWTSAPRLTGDWPDYWRRGMVYDLETIRMVVRLPVGIYRHPWDAMQIQAPRVVLAETAMDALVLGYADPAAAQELLLGTFLDAPEPNVPCSREDGSYNMVAADGSVCGTSPTWGYPAWVAQLLWSLSPDPVWLERLYPCLAQYLGWWLDHRRDSGGHLFYACDWESGQDGSPRFGTQRPEGHPIRHVRPADLHAAMAQACGIAATFASTLGKNRDVERWRTIEHDLLARTASLWTGDRWADVDSRSSHPIEVDDVMLAAPLALGVAAADQVAAVASGAWLDTLNAEALVWPMFAWTATEALRAIGQGDRAASIAHRIVDRVYRFWDAPVAHPDRTLPGIAAEYWPLHGRGGGEGYGWGAFGVHLLLASIVGLRAEDGRVDLAPRFPTEWRVSGRRFRLELTLRGERRAIDIEPIDAGTVTVRLDGEAHNLPWGQPITIAPAQDVVSRTA